MSTESTIFEALAAQLSTVAGPTPIAWPDMAFTPPTNGKFYRVSDFPVSTDAFTLNGTSQFIGFWQVDAMTEQGKGALAAKDAAGIIATAFRNSTLERDGVRIAITAAHIGPTIQDDPRNQTPVTIRYRAFA